MTDPKPITAQALLFSQGFGTRRECSALILDHTLQLGGRTVVGPHEQVAVEEGMPFVVNGQTWPYHARATLALNKPAGHECSTQPAHNPSVLELLPAPLRTRGVQPVGRLDVDTSGLLLLSDDGPFNHRMTSPKRAVHKVYRATLKHAADEAFTATLLRGVVLRDDPQPAVARQARLLDATTLELTLDEGRYHQVKRMVAAAGNRVVALHRCAIGGHVLRSDCAPGSWYWLSTEELARVQEQAQTQTQEQEQEQEQTQAAPGPLSAASST